jgi:hypothetical protein
MKATCVRMPPKFDVRAARAARPAPRGPRAGHDDIRLQLVARADLVPCTSREARSPARAAGREESRGWAEPVARGSNTRDNSSGDGTQHRVRSRTYSCSCSNCSSAALVSDRYMLLWREPIEFHPNADYVGPSLWYRHDAHLSPLQPARRGAQREDAVAVR